ncbi:MULTISPECIES: YpiF family protein [unclassified Bacillus (in: firmicutes)]|uniref:YpiF family protein n=1 Tax=unclassified Bacillus (in: firmicutes) TaxID=185979 RepID=UPI0008E31347|nr:MULTISPECIES: YpiF family protein [unclassified Bacillus (in: firmicutes)]SFA98618.1 Protein of unknown function [Bacillus sp. UNCCL13]SFQ81175.1 Protein of unknown function [Bacillus sp. cl95]
MKWVPQDIEMYLKSKEYVDTAVIPLSPIAFGEDMKQAAAMTEFISLLSIQLERQFTGRLLLFPAHSYLKNAAEEKLISSLGELETEIKNAEFKHIFYITSDSNWIKRETELSGSVIWLPSLPLDKMDQTQKTEILDDQVKQMLQLFIQKWREND